VSTIAVVIVSFVGVSPASAKVVRLADLAPRWSPAAAVVGKRLFLFGGRAPYSPDRMRPKDLVLEDGVIVDPRTGDARIVAEAPFDPPLAGPEAIALNGDVFVSGTLCNARLGDDDIICVPNSPAVGIYDVDQDEWKRVDVPDAIASRATKFDRAHISPLGTTSDGRVVVMIRTGQSFLEGIPDEFWTYSIKKDRWIRLPDAGFSAESSCVANDELVLLRVKYEERGVVTETDPEPRTGGSSKYYVQPSLAVLEFENGAAWRETVLEPTARYDSSPPSISCLDGHVMLVSPTFWDRGLLLFDKASNRWSAPASPPPNSIFSVHRLWTGTELIVLASEVDVGKPSVAYNPSTNTWRELDGLPLVTRHALWSGAALIGYQEPLGAPPNRAKPGVYRYVP
jgi:hypothetical protein